MTTNIYANDTDNLIQDYEDYDLIDNDINYTINELEEDEYKYNGKKAKNSSKKGGNRSTAAAKKDETEVKLNKIQRDVIQEFELELARIPTTAMFAYEDGEILSQYDDINTQKNREVYVRKLRARPKETIPKKVWPLSILLSQGVSFEKIMSFSSGSIISYNNFNKAFTMK